MVLDIIGNKWKHFYRKQNSPTVFAETAGEGLRGSNSKNAVPEKISGTAKGTYLGQSGTTRPNSSGRKRGQTLSVEVMTEAARRVPMFTASGRVRP